MTWISLALFCEGAHFTLVPNILKKIFGRQATSLYGIAFSYTGLASVLILVLLERYPTDYLMFFKQMALNVRLNINRKLQSKNLFLHFPHSGTAQLKL